MEFIVILKNESFQMIHWKEFFDIMYEGKKVPDEESIENMTLQ